jgi:hypothetical protein
MKKGPNVHACFKAILTRADKLSSGAIFILHIVWYPMALAYIASRAKLGAVYRKNVKYIRFGLLFKSNLPLK